MTGCSTFWPQMASSALAMSRSNASLVPKKAEVFLSDKAIEFELEEKMLALDSDNAPFYVDRPTTV